jgi:hypothetical protein
MHLLKDKGIGEKKFMKLIGIITYPSEHTPLFDSQLDS